MSTHTHTAHEQRNSPVWSLYRYELPPRGSTVPLNRVAARAVSFILSPLATSTRVGGGGVLAQRCTLAEKGKPVAPLALRGPPFNNQLSFSRCVSLLCKVVESVLVFSRPISYHWRAEFRSKWKILVGKPVGTPRLWPGNPVRGMWLG